MASWDEKYLNMLNAWRAGGAKAREADRDGVTPLMIAAREPNSLALWSFIGEGADVNAADKDGKTPLMYAAEKGAGRNARELLAAGANVNAADNGGMTPCCTPP